MATKTATQTQTTLLQVLSNARAEVQALVNRGIDLAEKRSKAMFRFARNAAKRLGGARKKAKRRN